MAKNGTEAVSRGSSQALDKLISLTSRNLEPWSEKFTQKAKRIIFFFGPAGSGKTTARKGVADRSLQVGIPVEELAYDEIRAHLEKVFDLPDRLWDLEKWLHISLEFKERFLEIWEKYQLDEPVTIIVEAPGFGRNKERGWVFFKWLASQPEYQQYVECFFLLPNPLILASVLEQRGYVDSLQRIDPSTQKGTERFDFFVEEPLEKIIETLAGLKLIIRHLSSEVVATYEDDQKKRLAYKIVEIFSQMASPAFVRSLLQELAYLSRRPRSDDPDKIKMMNRRRDIHMPDEVTQYIINNPYEWSVREDLVNISVYLMLLLDQISLAPDQKHLVMFQFSDQPIEINLLSESSLQLPTQKNE